VDVVKLSVMLYLGWVEDNTIMLIIIYTTNKVSMLITYK